MVSFQSAKDEIKRSADIVEVIGQFVQLKKAGKNFMGLCPFHGEKDPSFTVSQDRQMFHCFGCKKGGDLFDFWMAYHNFTFPEALKDLAERYNVTISGDFSASEEKKKSDLRESLFEMNDMAATFFQKVLNHEQAGKVAADYFRSRGISKEIIAEFRLGYSPDKWDGLTRYLMSNNADPSHAVQAGLIIPKKNGGHYDRFRGRIMFPISNLRERIIGFGGRVLDDGMPKYLNTPETPIFHKGEFPYGLDSSFRSIREKGRAIIVEGYMDLLALKEKGLDEVVATLGTAMTEDHIRKIKGYAREAVVVFDSDEAGKSAAMRTLPIFLNEGLSAKAVVLPEGHDPDTYVKQNGLAAFEKLVEKADPIFDFYLNRSLSLNTEDVEGKVNAMKEILPVLAELRNMAQCSLYVRGLAERIGIREDVVLTELASFRKSRSADELGRALREKISVSRPKSTVCDSQLLNLMVHHPETISQLYDSECMDLLSDPGMKEIVRVILHEHRRTGGFSPDDFKESLNTEVQGVLREMLVSESIYSDGEIDQAVSEMKSKAYEKKLSRSFREAVGDPAELNRLLKLKAQGPPGQ